MTSEQRLTALEQTVAELKRDLTEQGRLRAAVDKDLSDVTATVKATGHLVQALAITQSQHTEALARLEVGVARLEGGMGQIIGLLNTLIERDSE